MQPLILLVDDDKDILILLKAKLASSVCSVPVLDNVINTKPDLIMMDINMNGLDDGSLCYLLKTSHCTAHVPVVLFSGNDNIGEIAVNCKADAAVKETYDHKVFVDILQQFIGKSYGNKLEANLFSRS